MDKLSWAHKLFQSDHFHFKIMTIGAQSIGEQGAGSSLTFQTHTHTFFNKVPSLPFNKQQKIQNKSQAHRGPLSWNCDLLIKQTMLLIIKFHLN